MFNSSNVYQKPGLVNYLSLGCGGKKVLTLKLTIKFLIALTNDTCGRQHAGVGFKLSIKIGWSDNQKSVM
jgi:hypothetical protein